MRRDSDKYAAATAAMSQSKELAGSHPGAEYALRAMSARGILSRSRIDCVETLLKIALSQFTTKI